MQDKDIKVTPEIAEALLEYIAMEDCNAKTVITVLAKSEIERYLKEVNTYAVSLNITQEEALQKIIEQRS